MGKMMVDYQKIKTTPKDGFYNYIIPHTEFRLGAVAITKRDGEWIEGTFHFIAASSKSDKKVQVTEGTFRIK